MDRYMYMTILELQENTTRERLGALLEELTSFGCRLRPGPCAKRWTLEVPSDLLTWVKTGGLLTLLANYRDAVRWTAPFRSSRLAHDDSFVVDWYSPQQLKERL